MFLDASRYEELLDYFEGYRNEAYPKIEYGMFGNSILLRLIEARTYGGAVRCYLDDEYKPMSTGSTTSPMKVRRPFRLAANSAYVLMFHLSIKDELPADVIANIIPTKQAAEIGLLFTDAHLEKGNLSVTVMPLRMIEIWEGYPIAQLVFKPLEINSTYNKNTTKTESKKKDGKKTESKKTDSKSKGTSKKKSSSKGTDTNAKNPSSK